MTFDADTLRRQIPYYLTAAPAQKELVGELKALNEGAMVGYYLHKLSDPHGDNMMQGDGWPGFQLFSFQSGDRSSVRGIVMSNSCDVSPDNDRALSPKVTFAPIVKLSAIRNRLEQRDFTPAQIDGKLQSIRTQSVTSIFYLPADAPLDEEYVALLDDLHSMPVAAYEKNEKLFTLSMAGFYLFVFKLSVHFCRFNENVDRTPRAATA